jgi:hypothetical protein
MAITRILNAKLALIGDGAATTYALNTSTGCYQLMDQASNTPLCIALSLPIGSLVTAVQPAAGATQIFKIPYTVAFGSNTATFTFASAIPNGALDYVSLNLVVP